MEPEARERLKAMIEEAEKAARVAREEIERAKRAEIDVAEQERELMETERKLRLLRAVYIEGR